MQHIQGGFLRSVLYFLSFFKALFFRYLKRRKIQGIYFKIQGTYFKISALYFLR